VTRAISALTRAAVRCVLACQPRRFRDEFAREILDAVDRDLAEAAVSGRGAHARASARAVLDALTTLSLTRSTRSRGHAAAPIAIAQDLRIAWRHLRAQRGTTLAIASTLSLALAAAIAMFAVAEAALLRPLPYPDGNRLVRLEERTERGGRAGVSIPAFDIWQRELTSLAAAAFYEPRDATVTVNGEPERLAGAGVSREFFSVIGVVPAIGRVFTPGARFGPPDEAVISERLFERLGGTGQVIGSTIAIDPHSYEVVGVMPRGFAFPANADFWVTSKGMGVLETERSLRFLETIGRMKTDASLRGLQGELALMTARYPANDRIGGAVHMTAFSLRDAFVGNARPAMRLAMIGVALLLVVACCNVSALVLARMSARARDLALHRALGASRYRLARQCALEMLAIAIPAGIFGTLLASRLLGVLVALANGEVPGIANVQVNGVVAFFAVAVTVLCALAASVVPAAFAGGMRGLASLQTREVSASRGLLAALRVLVVAQVAMGFVVAVCAALLARSVERLMTAEHGFDPSHVAVARINFPLGTAVARAGQVAFYGDVVERARTLPGVAAVGLLSRMPMSPALASSEAHVEEEPTRSVRAVLQSASPGALPAIGARFLAGGDFPSAPATTPEVIINDELARVLFAGQNPLDRRITFRFLAGTLTARVAGVVRAVRYNGLSGELLPSITLDYRTFPFPMSLVARTYEDADALLPHVRAIVRGVDPTNRVTVDQLTTLDREVSLALARPRFFTAVMSAFSLVVLALSGAGVFGLLSFYVGQRRRELGIRRALGAPARVLLLSVTARAVMTVAPGIALGAAAATMVTGSMSSMLFGVGRADPLSFAACTLLFVTAAVVAAGVPARRAGQVDPLTVLRSE